MFFDQAEFDRQVGEYLALGMTLAESESLARWNEQLAAEEFERWQREEAEMEFED